MDRQTFEKARRISHDTMEERVSWVPPQPLMPSGCLVIPGANSTEKHTQKDREMGILQEIFLSKERYLQCSFHGRVSGVVVKYAAARLVWLFVCLSVD